MAHLLLDLSSLVADYVGISHTKNDLCEVQREGCALQFVEEQTHEICLAAVQQYGYALQLVKEQTHEICLAAVQQNCYTLEVVKTKPAKSALPRSNNMATP